MDWAEHVQSDFGKRRAVVVAVQLVLLLSVGALWNHERVDFLIVPGYTSWAPVIGRPSSQQLGAPVPGAHEEGRQFAAPHAARDTSSQQTEPAAALEAAPHAARDSSQQTEPAAALEQQLEPAAALEAGFNAWSFERRSAAFLRGTPLAWEYPKPAFSTFRQLFEGNLDVVNSTTGENRTMEIWADTSRRLVQDERVCTAAVNFRRAGSVKPHVLFAHFNSNWGAFSGYVPNRTVDWGNLAHALGVEGPRGRAGICSWQDAMEYINHNNTLGIVTTQFQQMDHPKVHSIPIGFGRRFNPILELMNRTELLMISAAPTPERKPQIDTVIKNFKGTVQNVFGGSTNLFGSGRQPTTKEKQANIEAYIRNLSRSKFMMSPSGMGWDCYRNWEALSCGTIPVIEHLNRSDGWRRTFDGLPVVWVASMDEVTPALLESEYRRLSQSRNYTWEKLTREYWQAFVYSLASRQV